MMYKYSLFCFLLALFTSIIFSANAQDFVVEPFTKISVRGQVVINYVVSSEPEILTVKDEQKSLVKYCVKNGTLKIKHTKLKPNKNKKAELTISGKPLKEICLRQGAVFNTGMVSLADTAKIRIASGSEIQSKIKSQKLDAIVRSGSFCYLEGELSNLTAKVRSGSRLRCSGAIINKAYIKIAAGSFAAFKDNTDIEGKVTTGSELKLYGTGNTNPKVNTHTHGKITTSNGDEL